MPPATDRAPVVALITTVPDTGDGITEPKLRSSILVSVSGISSKARPVGGVGEETGAAATLVVPSATAAIANKILDRFITLTAPQIICQSELPK